MLNRAVLLVLVVAANVPAFVQSLPGFTPVQPALFAAGGTFANAFADIDGDDDLDVFVGFNGRHNRLYRNDGGSSTDVAAAAGVADARPTRVAAWRDADADGDADLLVGFTPAPGASVLRCYRNSGGVFTDATAAAGLTTATGAVRRPVWVDADADGDLDLFVAFRDRGNALVRNDGGVFSDVAPALRLADVDVDGRFNLLAANYGPLGLALNPGGGRFVESADAWGLAIDSRYDSCAPADVDHDGQLDLFVNGRVTNGVSWQDSLLRHTGRAFVDVTPPVLRAFQADHGVQSADVDGDGDLDLALAGARPDGMHALLRNDLAPDAAARGLHVRVVAAAGRATLAGAEVRVFAAGSRRLVGARLVDAGSGYDAQNDLPVQVGVPAGIPRVDVQLIVPRGGRRVPVWTRNVAVRGRRDGPLVVRAPK